VPHFHNAKPLKGMVNAVLRKVSEEGIKSWNDLRIPRLPDWLRRDLVKIYGAKAVLAMEAVQHKPAPVDLTPKDSTTTFSSDMKGVLTPSGSLRITAGAQISRLPGFETGQWWVQDAAASLPAKILNAQHGETVLDICAAPGGKTMQLAATGAKVTALDQSAERMSRLHDNMARVGLPADVGIDNALDHQGGPYDAVLIDAPCSATGTIRRHPDLPYAKTRREFAELFKLQSKLLDHATRLISTGGRVLYCTCSLLPEEGETQVQNFLQRTGWQTDREALLVRGVDPTWVTPEGGLRLRPDYWAELGGMDGFYMALLRPPEDAKIDDTPA